MPTMTPHKRDPRYPDFPTIVHALAYAAEHRANAPGIACLGRELTYGQYGQAVAALARTFIELSADGERVVYVMRNSLEMVALCQHGLPRAGGAAQSFLYRPRDRAAGGRNRSAADRLRHRIRRTGKAACAIGRRSENRRARCERRDHRAIAVRAALDLAAAGARRSLRHFLHRRAPPAYPRAPIIATAT